MIKKAKIIEKKYSSKNNESQTYKNIDKEDIINICKRTHKYK